MGYDKDKTKVIGRREIQDDFPEEYSEFNNVYDEGAPAEEVDELAYLDEVEVQGKEYDRDSSEEYDAPVRKRNEGDRKKKPAKSKKGIIIAAAVLLVLACGGAFAYMTLFGPHDVEVDLTATMNEPEITGFEGEGQLGEITLNQDAADEIIASMKSDAQKEAAAEFFASVEYAPDKTEGLSNGDKIIITASYDEELAESARITVTETELEYVTENLKEDENKISIDIPQWYRIVLPAADELSITCILLAEEGTSVTLPIQFMYCQPGGAMSEMIDTSGSPDITYNGTGYFMEDGFEAPVGKVTEIDNSHVVYSVKQYGSSFKIKVTYTINSDGTLNVESASGGEAEIPTGKYEPISASMAKTMGGSN